MSVNYPEANTRTDAERVATNDFYEHRKQVLARINAAMEQEKRNKKNGRNG